MLLQPSSSDAAGSAKTSFLTLFPSIMLPMFLAVIDQTIVATALPNIAGDLHSVEWTSGVVIAYLMAAAILSPVYGRLGDVFGRRRLMFVAIGVFVGASLLCAVSNSIEMLISARVLQGIGGGGLMTLSQALIGEAVPPRDRAGFQGFIAAVAVCSNTFGPVLGGLLTEAFGWRSIFLVNIPLGALAAFLVLRLPVRVRAPEAFRFDTPGLLLFATMVFSLLSALQELQRFQPSGLPLVGVLATICIVSAASLLWWQKRAPDPLLPLAVLRNPSIWRSDLMAALHGATLVSLITYLPIFYRVAYGASPTAIGFLILPMTLTMGLGSMATGWIVSKTGRSALFPSWGLSLTALTLVALGYRSVHMTSTQVAALLAFTAFFMGTVMGVVQVTVQTAAGTKRLGTAAATVQLSRALGAAVGTAIVGLVLFSVIGLTDPSATGAFGILLQRGPDALTLLPLDQRLLIEGGIKTAFRAAFFAIGSFAMISSVLAWTLPVRRL